MMKKVLLLTLILCMVFSFAACGEKPESAAEKPETKTGEPAPAAQKTDERGEPEKTEEQPTAQPAETDTEQPSAPSEVRESADTELYFEVEGYQFTVLSPMEKLVSAIGEPDDSDETASCAYQGSDYLYYYDRYGFELTCNEIDGVRVVTAIKLIDDTVAMPQGVKIGMPVGAVLPVLPKEYTQNGSVYSFVSGICTLLLQEGTDGTVKAINYLVTAEQ